VHAVSRPFSTNANEELLQRIADVTSLCSQVSEALEIMIDQQGGQGEPVTSARALRAALCDLKRELLRHYLDCRIMEAAYPTHAMNN
jgi:hypothetical protein